MTTCIPSSRALARAATLALGPAVLLVCACTAGAFTPSRKGAGSESTPLNLGGTPVGPHTSSGGGSIVRTIVGLLIVIAVIWGLSWILRQVKSGRETRAAGSGLASIATLPLGSNRSLHLVRAGSDYVLLGSAEQGVVPIYRYTEEQALQAGLLDLAEPEPDEQPPAAGATSTHPSGPDSPPGARRPATRIEMPGQRRRPAQEMLERLREWTVRR